MKPPMNADKHRCIALSHAARRHADQGRLPAAGAQESPIADFAWHPMMNSMYRCLSAFIGG